MVIVIKVIRCLSSTFVGLVVGKDPVCRRYSYVTVEMEIDRNGNGLLALLGIIFIGDIVSKLTFHGIITTP